METPEQRIKIAVQKTGRLTLTTRSTCSNAVASRSPGARTSSSATARTCPSTCLLVRDDDIPGLVGEDVCDLGIVGLNVVEEKRLTRESEGRKTLFKQVFELDFGHCRLALAAPDSVAVRWARVSGKYPYCNKLRRTS